MDENVEDDITVVSQHTAVPDENGIPIVVNHSKISPPFSVLWATFLYCAEFICASVLCSMYHKSNNVIWMGLTITFMLVPAVLTQLTLSFIHRDFYIDRPLGLLVQFMHLLQMGPIIRCTEALVLYFKASRNEEPYVTSIRKIKLKNGNAVGLPMEWEIGQSEHKLTVHRDAFKRTAVIQAFLGSTPQLTLQMYAAIQDKYIFPLRLSLMIISLISIMNGALVCSVLAIQIHYVDYNMNVKAGAYVCMVLWRGLEIATRVTSLVLFSTALSFWVVPVGLANLLIFFFHPWVELWSQRASLPENVEKNLRKVGTCVVLCLFTLFYSCINICCWSAVQLNLAKEEMIEKQLRWSHLAIYYTLRFIENVALIVAWYFFKPDFYEYVSAPLLVAQLIVCYVLAVFFMLLFYQFCHPACRLFKYNMEDCLHCACCWKKGTCWFHQPQTSVHVWGRKKLISWRTWRQRDQPV